jgi:peroxiredoxin
MKNWLFLLFVLVSGALPGQSQVKNFAAPDAQSGQTVSLDQYAPTGVVVVLFTSNECPFDKYYTDRVAKLISDYAGKAKFLLINSHLDPEETGEKMKEKAAVWGLSVPYLADKNQEVMTALGARRSPEAFILRHEKTHFAIAYSGAIDDNAQEPSAVTINHLRAALDSILGGKHTGHHQVRGAGCTIRKK